MTSRGISILFLLTIITFGCTPSSKTTLHPADPATLIPTTPSMELIGDLETPAAASSPTLVLPGTGILLPDECPQPSGGTYTIAPVSPGTSIIEGFEHQLLEYLNTVGSAEGLETALDEITLPDGSTTWQSKVQVKTIDITGDTAPEVLVDLLFFVEGQYADGAIFVYACRDGRFIGGSLTSIGGQVFPGYEPEHAIRAVQDMNNNSVPEIVISYIEIMGTHSNFTRCFEILEWDGDDFVPRIQGRGYEPHSIKVENGDGVIEDADGDGTIDLVITSGMGRGPEASSFERPRKEIWSWDGQAFTLQCSSPEGEPVFRWQALQDGDDAARCGDYDAALALYQQAVFDEELLGWSEGRFADDTLYSVTPTPDPNERPRINAYGRYRIMLLHVAHGFLPEAKIVYETLLEKFPSGIVGSQYAELAAAFWIAFEESGDIGYACSQAASHAAIHEDKILRPLGQDFYGSIGYEYTPEDICPYKYP